MNNTKVNPEWKVGDNKYQCPHCLLIYSKFGICTHIFLKHSDKGNDLLEQHSIRLKTKPTWNLGLTKFTDERVRKNGESVAKYYQKCSEEGKSRKIGKMSEEARTRLSIKQSLHNSGGKCKWFEVAGKKVQGTWEMNLAMLFESLNIKWFKPKTNKDVFIYELDNKRKSYTPDFYLPEYNLYLEVKGYWWGNDKNKMKLVLTAHDILREQLILILKPEYTNILKLKSKEEVLNYLETVHKANLVEA